MCGIFGFTSTKLHPSNLVFNGLKNLEYRGYDSWGIVADSLSKLVDEKHLGKIFSKPNVIPESTVSIGHTRWATHGGITLANCHPHFDCQRQIALVHNGIVENHQLLRNKLKSQGHKFTTETDTEVIVHLIEEYNKNNSFPDSVRLAFLDLQGLNAIAVIKHQSNQLIIAKNGSPLVVGFGQDENYIASDVSALTELTDKFIFLEDNQMAILAPKSFSVLQIKTGDLIELETKTISSSQADIGLDGHPNYLSKEIYQQPEILNQIQNGYLNESIDKIINLAKSSDHVFFTGCGSSYFAAYFNSLVVSQKINQPIFCFPASEFEPYDQFLTPKSLLVVFSQSGETIDVINLVNSVKKRGVVVASVINTPYSTLHRLADICQLLPCGPEKCVLSTKTFIAEIALFLKSLGENLSPVIDDINRILQPEFTKKITTLAKKLAKHDRIFVISRGSSLSIGHETALKIKEVSYVHAESVSASELKHGPIALIEPKTPCIVIAPNDKHYDDIISSATEIKARGGWIIGISPKPNPIFDDYFPVNDSGSSTALAITVISQFLAYQICQIKGYDPDKPRNLAKSVTVK
jgi:glucosamine--fructose-6-phosphate aminotransferase (isomerizing)